MIKTYLFGHVDESSAYVVDDYPYGFRQRTQIRYWIESVAKKGDRVCSQTLNPKTLQWNKPKKSTYSAVCVLGLNDQNHVTNIGFALGWDNEEKILDFIEKIGGVDKLNDLQLKQVKRGIAISRTQKHIKVEVVNATNWSEGERQAHKEKQARVKKTLAKIYAYNMAKLA